MSEKKAIPTGKIIFGAAGALVFLIFSYVLKAPLALEEAAAAVGSSGVVAMRILGITLLAVFWWVGNVMTDWLTTLVMLILWVLAAEVPFATAFASYASTSSWLIVGAFCLSEAVSKTGLFTRVSWFLLRIFPPTLNGQVLAMLLVGALCTPLIPSMTAKAILGVTVANGVATAMGFDKNSSGRYALYIAAWTGFALTAPAFVNGSVFGYTVLGALPEDEVISYGTWLVAMIPWLVIVLALSFVSIKLMYRSKQEGVMTREYAQEHYNALGKLEGKELLSAVILVGVVVLWVLETKLGISSAITALIAMVLCFAFGILDLKEIATAPKWSTFIFLGGVLSLGPIFSRVGINAWLQTLLTPLFLQINNVYLAALVIMLMTVALRLILASFSATIIIMMTILTPVSKVVGLSPFIIGMLVYTAENCWFVRYQNSVFVTCYACVKDDLDFNGTVKASLGFMIINIIACLISIPYWSLLGYI